MSKTSLDIFETATGTAGQIANEPTAIAAFLARLPREATVVFEATGLYDAALRAALDEAGMRSLRVNPSRARDFARAAGLLAKTDTVDARMLARLPEALACRRHPPSTASAKPSSPPPAPRPTRRNARRRARPPRRRPDAVKPGEPRHIDWLDAAIEDLETRIEAALTRPELELRVKLLRSIKGVGPVTIATSSP